MTAPNFLHLGPGKAGSTWVHETLALHPQVYVTPAKDLYFFSRYFDRGRDWYVEQFAGAPASARAIGEVCPDYLATPEGPERIVSTLGDGVRLAVTLRDPADRAFSSYLYLQKHGLAAPTFRDTMARNPELVDEGRYGTQLRRYADLVDRSLIHVGLFDDLEADPQGLFDALTDFLGVDRLTLSEEALGAKLPASKARFLPLAVAAQRAAQVVRRFDGAGLVGKVKRSALVQKALYRPLGADRPQMSDADRSYLHETLRPELEIVRDEFGIDVLARWGWA
jgi:hypothetical protein